MQQRNDLPPDAFPPRGLTRYQRFDVPAAALPYRKGTKPHRPDVLVPAIPDATGFSVATEWLGRLAAVIAVVLFALVVASIHKGLQVQHSARTVVDNFRLTNDFFAQRADLTAPATARKQLDELTGVLTQLNIATATDVDHLDALLPNARTLLAAGQGDTQIAGQLEGGRHHIAGLGGLPAPDIGRREHDRDRRRQRTHPGTRPGEPAQRGTHPHDEQARARSRHRRFIPAPGEPMITKKLWTAIVLVLGAGVGGRSVRPQRVLSRAA